MTIDSCVPEAAAVRMSSARLRVAARIIATLATLADSIEDLNRSGINYATKSFKISCDNRWERYLKLQRLLKLNLGHWINPRILT